MNGSCWVICNCLTNVHSTIYLLQTEETDFLLQTPHAELIVEQVDHSRPYPAGIYGIWEGIPSYHQQHHLEP